MSENITAVGIQHDSDSEPIVHLSDGSSIALNALVAQALKWQHAKSPGAVDRAMNRAEHADQLRVRAEREAAEATSMWRSEANRAGLWERKAGKIIEQARSWKERAVSAERVADDLFTKYHEALDQIVTHDNAVHEIMGERYLRDQAQQHALTAQANALDTIQRIAAQLPVDPIIDAEVVVPDVEVDTWFGEDDTPVVQIDTHRGHGRLRINLNDGVVWDGDPETDERPGKNAELIEWEQRALAQAETISRQLDTIRDQAEKIEELVQTLKNRNGEGDPADPGAHGGAIPRYGMLDVWQAIQRSADVRAFDAFYDHHGYAEAWATLLAELRKLRDDLDRRERLSDDDARAVRALQARKVELEAEVRAERGALAVCQTQLTDAKAALAESERAFSAIDAARVELAEKVTQLEEQRAAAARNLSQVSAERAQAWLDLDVQRVADLDSLRAEKAEAIAHCNEQLEALAKTAKLRDRQVATLSRLWVAKTDDERSLFGTVFARQLYRVFADHGIDVEHDMPAYPANIGALITPAEMPVTDRIIREYNHLREHAELVLQADMRNRGRFLGDGLRSALAGLRDAVNNGAPDPTPDIADCA